MLDQICRALSDGSGLPGYWRHSAATRTRMDCSITRHAYGPHRRQYYLLLQPKDSPADAPLPDAVVDRLAWIGVAEYLMTDTGGQSAADLLPGQRMAAANIVKLKPLPTATTRVLAGDAVTLLASWRVNPLGEAEQQCRLALDLDVPPEPTAGRHGDLESGAAETADGTLTTLTFRPNRLDLGADAPHLVIDQTLRFPQERDP